MQKYPTPNSQPVVWNSSHPPAFAYADHHTNEQDLYPGAETEYIESFAPVDPGIGVTVRLASSRNDFHHFTCSVDGAPAEPCPDGRLVIRFDPEASARVPDLQRRETRIEVINTNGEKTASHYLHINHVPSALYRARGRIEDGYGRILVRETDLNLKSSPVEDWILDQPTPDEVEFARTTWGASLAGLDSDFDRARAIGTQLVRELDSHRGTPSDTMDQVRPFTQYRRLITGEDLAWCSNLAEILVHACNALDIPTRYIVMGHIVCPRELSGAEDYSIMLTTGHTTTEVFDRRDGQWCWMDLTYNALGLWLGEEGPLNMLELHRFVNQPARLRRLQIDLCDPATGIVTRTPLAESPLGERIRNAFRQDQIFRYMRRPLCAE